MDAKTLLLQALDAAKEEQIRMLQEFVRAASPNPPGSTATAAAVLTAYLDGKGIPYEVVDPQGGQPNIVSDFQGTKGPGPRVVLNGHIDVFPVGDATGWTRDPWSGDVEDGRIHGRGVVDMKSGTASLVIAFAYLYERRDMLCGSVALCAVSDEETGGKWGTKYLLEQDRTRWGGDVMLSTEPGGCGSVRFSEKGTLRMTCTVKTAGAHGAYINLSKGAVRTSARFVGEVIDAVEAMPVDLPQEMADQIAKPEVRRRIDEMMGPGTSAIIARPTVNVGTIRGGLKVNMIPDTCVFELDIRLPVGLVRDQVLELISSLIPKYDEATFELSVHEAASNPFSFSSISHPMVNLLADNAALVAPNSDRPVAIPSMGATDCKHYRYAGVPAYVYGCSPKTSKQFFSPVSYSFFLIILPPTSYKIEAPCV
jgi:succinyl-diaminopimelate desuccinylase